MKVYARNAGSLGTDFHVGDIVRNRGTGGHSVVRSVGTWSSRFYELVACPHPTGEPPGVEATGECGRLSVWRAVQGAAGSRPQSCVERLASGWILTGDLCPHCTRTFMRALDDAVPDLNWGQGYRDRADGEVSSDG